MDALFKSSLATSESISLVYVLLIHLIFLSHPRASPSVEPVLGALSPFVDGNEDRPEVAAGPLGFAT